MTHATGTVGRLLQCVGVELLGYSKEELVQCSSFRDACCPKIVFEQSAQAAFRKSLEHFGECMLPVCVAFQNYIHLVMLYKLRTMKLRGTVLGCESVKVFLYLNEDLYFPSSFFKSVALHLALCTDPSCAQLVRALLLEIRPACLASYKSKSFKAFRRELAQLCEQQKSKIQLPLIA